MSVVAKTLISAKYAETTAKDEYRSPSGKRAIIDKFTVTNTDSNTATITIHIPLPDKAAGNENLIIKAKSIAAGATSDLTELQNQILENGEKLSILASIASKIVIRASEREVT